MPLVADKAWTSVRYGVDRKVVTRVWFEVFGLVVLAFLPVILVYLVPDRSFLRYFAVRDHALGPPDFARMMRLMTQVSRTHLPLVFLIKFMLLFNLPSLGDMPMKVFFGTGPIARLPPADRLGLFDHEHSDARLRIVGGGRQFPAMRRRLWLSAG